MIVPKPNYHEIGENKWLIKSITTNNQTSINVEHMVKKINELLNYPSGQDMLLNIVIDESLKGYELRIENEITLKGLNAEQIHYGLVSLLQLVIESIEQNIIDYPNSSDHCPQGMVELQEQHIIDYPRFNWRGVLLDVSRHFFNKEVVFKIIDLMSLHKLNVLHLHLSDDQGFRVESLKFPKLTEISTKRDGSTFDKDNNTHEEYKGYFTQQEIKQIVEYAGMHYIKVVPEIDVPGHITAILAAYPNLSCREVEKKVATGIGYYTDSLCMSNPEKVSFILDIIEEVAMLFPDKILHFGGDEVSLKHALECPSCKRVISDNRGDPHVLFKILFDQIETRFHALGYTIISWSDIWKYIDASGENHYTQLWMDLKRDDIFRKVPNNGLYCINSNTAYFYADYDYRIVEMNGTYNYDISKGVKDEGYVLGSELALWTEFIPDTSKLYKQLLPRLSAFSENLWTMKDRKDYKAFLKNEKHIIALYQFLGIQEYTPFNKTSARILRGSRFYLLRMFLYGVKRVGLIKVIKYVKTGELTLEEQ
jgi:hexosaminidase